MPASEYDRILLRVSAILHVRPAVLRHIDLALLIVLAVALGGGLSWFFNRQARRRRASWTEAFFHILAVLPMPALLTAAIYIDLNVLMLTIHSAHVQLLERASAALWVGAAYYLPTRIGLLFLRRWGKMRPGREKATRLFAFLIEAAVVLIAVYTLLEALRLAPANEHFVGRILMTLAIFLGCYGGAKMLTLYLSRLSREDPSVLRFTEPAVFAARAAFGLLAVMIVLENLGVHLTAVWTTLGVGSVAIAMALQETLSNFFAGLYLLADRPIRAGDYVQLDSGQEGYVLRVGWRSTSIRSLYKNLVVVPNSTLAKAVITNYSPPERQMLMPIEVGVAYGTDPRLVTRVLKEVADEAVKNRLPGIGQVTEATVRFMPGFGDSSLNFTLVVEVQDFTDQFPVQTELRTRILERFQQEQIEFAFPTRTLVLDRSTQQILGLRTEGQLSSQSTGQNGSAG